MLSSVQNLQTEQVAKPCLLKLNLRRLLREAGVAWEPCSKTPSPNCMSPLRSIKTANFAVSMVLREISDSLTLSSFPCAQRLAVFDRPAILVHPAVLLLEKCHQGMEREHIKSNSHSISALSFVLSSARLFCRTSCLSSSG
jgi:hypothetical protein